MAAGMIRNRLKIFAPRAALSMALVAMVAVLGGCSELRSAAGIEKSTPDEFKVRVRQPLNMPPDFRVRAPRPGTKGPNEARARNRAEEIVIEADTNRRGKRRPPRQIKGLSRQETALVNKLGGNKVSSNIRLTVETETAAINENNKSFVDSIMFWQEKPPPGKAVDPRKEARRIQGNAALGRRADTGKTPVIERKSKGLFSKGLFKDWF